MTKKSGLGAVMFVNGYDLSNDTGAVNSMGMPRGVLDVTGINKSAFERILSTKDGNLDWSAYFNPATDQAHDVYSPLPTSDVGIIFGQATAIGDAACAMTAKQLGYNGTRAQDGGFTFQLNALANGFGLEWGQFATAGIRTDSTATNGAAFDGAASTAFGLQAWCHLFAFTGTSVTIKLQGDDNSGFTSATDVTGGSFGALSTPRTSHRLATANNQTIERYLRVVTTGTFSNAVFAVVVNRNLHAGVTY